MLVAPGPDDVRLEFGPVTPVLRISDIAQVAIGLGPAAEDPQVIPVHDRGEPQPGLPGSRGGDLLPVHAIFRTLDVVGGKGPRVAGAAAQDPQFVVEGRTISSGGCFVIAMAGCGSLRSTAAWRT